MKKQSEVGYDIGDITIIQTEYCSIMSFHYVYDIERWRQRKSTILIKLVAHLGLLDSFLLATAVQVANDGLRLDHHRS